MTDVKPSLKAVLKRLKLSGMVPTLPDRAGLEEAHTFEEVEGNVPVTSDRQRVRYLFRLGLLDRHEDLLLFGPVGGGTTTPPSLQGAGPRTTTTTLPSSPTTPSGIPSA